MRGETLINGFTRSGGLGLYSPRVETVVAPFFTVLTVVTPLNSCETPDPCRLTRHICHKVVNIDPINDEHSWQQDVPLSSTPRSVPPDLHIYDKKTPTMRSVHDDQRDNKNGHHSAQHGCTHGD